MTPINRQMWVRVRVGAFESVDEAREFGERLSRQEATEFFVAEAPMKVVERVGTRVLLVPSGVWLMHNDAYREIVRTGTHTEGQMVDVSVDVSHDGRRIAVMQGEALSVFDAGTGELLWRRDDVGSIMPRVRYSPDGAWLAFQPVRDFEGEFSLWLMSASGGEPRKLVDTQGTGQTVRSFAWHPDGEQLFFVRGGSWGTLSLGGSILLTDLDGNVEVFREPSSDREQLAGELEVRDRILHYRIVRFDEEYINHTAMSAQISID
jgi:tricorn protease-like protein